MTRLFKYLFIAILMIPVFVNIALLFHTEDPEAVAKKIKAYNDSLAPNWKRCVNIGGEFGDWRFKHCMSDELRAAEARGWNRVKPPQ